jgi:hypothetical protein
MNRDDSNTRIYIRNNYILYIFISIYFIIEKNASKMFLSE